MMRKDILRTLAISTIKGFKLTFENGKPVIEELEPIIVLGKCNEKDGLKALQEKYGKVSGLTCGEISVEENQYKISIEDFLKYATKVEKGNSENVEEETVETN